MKKYKKEKFSFLWEDLTKKGPENGEYYFIYEWRWKWKYPFLFRKIILYILIDDIWVEQPD